MSFQNAVANTSEIRNCYKPGLKALGSHRVLVNAHNTRAFEGSVNLDECMAGSRPGENRWDYCFAYKGEVFFMEVHPAATSDVGTIINKLNWLKTWLSQQAPALDDLKAKTMLPFHWIHTGSSHILATSRQYKLAAENKILPKSKLDIKH